MITEDRLRDLLADRQAPQGISPDAARRRAVVLHRHHRVFTGLAALVAVLLVPSAVVGLRGFSTAGRTSLPYAFAGDGSALPVDPDGWVPLEVPGLFMYDHAGALCFGPRFGAKPGTTEYGLPGECLVEGADDYALGLSVGGGVAASITVEPVVRADFIEGSTIVHAQVAGLRRFSGWRTLTAQWPLPYAGSGKDDVLLRGWDAQGKLVLSVGCPDGCPAPAAASQPAVAPEPGNAAPVPAASTSPAG